MTGPASAQRTRKPREGSPSPARRSAGKAVEGTRILLVESSPVEAGQLEALLGQNGYLVEAVASAEAALARLEAMGAGMVIAEADLPEMSGYELCRRIKADAAGRRTPVLLLTGIQDPVAVFRVLESGADAYHAQPLEPDRLLRRVRSTLQRAAGATPEQAGSLSVLGRSFTVGADRDQILRLLVSAFEDVVDTYAALRRSRRELAAAKRKIEDHAQILEGRVQSTEERYRAIFESIAEGIMIVDETMTVTSMNPAALAMFGYAAHEAVGQPLGTFVAELRDAGAEGGAGPAGIPAAAGGEVTGLRRNGEAIPICLNFGSLTLEGRRMSIGVIRDLSAEKLTQRKLRQAQKMEAVGQLAGGVAHDFNNLLTVIMGNLEIIGEMTLGQPALHPLVKTALRAADRGADLTRRLLAVSRRQVLQPEIHDVDRLIANMEDLLRRTLGEAISISVEFEETSLRTRIDASELENAVLNLAINARDAMPDGGQLTIEVRAEHLDEDYAAQQGDLEPGDYVLVAVSDTGGGIPGDVIEHVFEPFFTTKDEGKGTGLGLSMVYGFARQSGGHVAIYSEEGHGTTVRLFLPRIPYEAAPDQATAAGAEPEADYSGLTALLVDDSDDVREIGAAMLRRLGFRTIEASGADEALELLDRHREIDLLFTDVVMPGTMNGIALAAQAARRRPDLRILFCSGYADAAIARSQGVGKEAVFVNKPYRRTDLRQKLDRVWKGEHRSPGGS